MPGFGGPSAPASRTLGGSDVHRAHRWRIVQVVGLSIPEFVYAKSLTLPEVAFEEEAVEGASVAYKFPSKAMFGDVEIVFYDMHNLYPQLDALRNKIWTPDGGLQAANNYMAESFFEQYDGKGVTKGRFKLTNSWVKKLSHSQLTYDSSELKTVSLTISYTWAEYQ